MKKVKIGDQVEYNPWIGQSRTATVKGIEICPYGTKYGRSVSGCDMSKHNGVLDLSDGHWCYFDQVKRVI
jgi:hypothetical protein